MKYLNRNVNRRCYDKCEDVDAVLITITVVVTLKLRQTRLHTIVKSNINPTMKSGFILDFILFQILRISFSIMSIRYWRYQTITLEN